jgi:hypothetical protein
VGSTVRRYVVGGCAYSTRRGRSSTVHCGSNPAGSGLGVNGKAHDRGDLHAVGAAFVRSIGAVDPFLTAMANALRVGHHIVERPQ